MLTTSKVGIVGLNIQRHAVFDISDQIPCKDDFKVCAADAKEKENSKSVNNDLNHDECPDRPLLGLGVRVTNAQQECAEAEPTKQGR
jgi:hypothetical protein